MTIARSSLAAGAQVGWITLAQYPGVLADVADAGEAGLLEKLDRRAEGKRHVASRQAVTSASPPPRACDLVQRAFQRRPRDA
jgi:hypothetical protein